MFSNEFVFHEDFDAILMLDLWRMAIPPPLAVVFLCWNRYGLVPTSTEIDYGENVFVPIMRLGKRANEVGGDELHGV